MHGKGVRDKFETGAVRPGSHWTLNHRAENGNFILIKSGQVGSYFFFSVELNRANFFFYEVGPVIDFALSRGLHRSKFRTPSSDRNES